MSDQEEKKNELNEDEKQILEWTENIEDRRIELLQLSQEEVSDKKTKRRLQIERLKKQIDLDLYRIGILKRKIANNKLSRLSLKGTQTKEVADFSTKTEEKVAKLVDKTKALSKTISKQK